MSDARAILGVGVGAAPVAVDPVQAAMKSPGGAHNADKKLKPPRGMSREVFNLLQTQQNEIAAGLSSTPLNDPSLQSTTLLPTMVPSSRPKGGKVGSMSKTDKVSKWVWVSFSSTARNDGADFHHWVKAGVEYPDYPFARFNVHLDSVEYTEEEYNTYLANSEWTRSDTDLLMGLCRRLDLRWAIIHDRYTATPRRTIEQLQHRYYSVASRLTHVRLTLASAGPIDPSNPISTLGTGSSSQSFNLSYEGERRRQLEVAWKRSKEEEQEENDLRKELKLVEVQLRKLKKAGKGEEPATSTTSDPHEAANSLFHRPLPTAGLPYLQSARLENPVGVNGLSKTLIKKMELVLRELEIEERPLPTKTVVDIYDHLRKSIVTLLTLQKIASKKENLLLLKKAEITQKGESTPFEQNPVIMNPQRRTGGVQGQGMKRKSDAGMSVQQQAQHAQMQQAAEKKLKK